MRDSLWKRESTIPGVSEVGTRCSDHVSLVHRKGRYESKRGGGDSDDIERRANIMGWAIHLSAKLVIDPWMSMMSVNGRKT